MTELTLEEKQRRIRQAEANTQRIVKESTRRERIQAYKTVKTVWAKLNEIEEKQKCLRVRFLDWVSNKLHKWGDKVHQISVNIDSPCVIKLPEKKK